MAYEYVNIKTDTIDNVKVPTKETLDARTIVESTLEPSDGNGTTICVYHIGLWQFPKTGLYKIHLTQHGTTNDLFKVFARKTKDDGTLPEDFTQDNIVIQHLAMGDTQVNDLYIQVDYIDNDKLTVYNVKFLTLLQPYNAQVNVYDKTTQKWQFVSATYVQSAKSANRLAHQLTLTKGDTTTEFNGSTAQTVSIPTKTSELTNDSFVSYAEQTLTEDQQNQAKTNLGIDVLTGNTTTVTPTQVKEAILAGRPVAITHVDNTYGNLLFTSFGYSLENNVVVANLVATADDQYILADLTGMVADNQWQLQTTEIATPTELDNLSLAVANNYVKYSESQSLTDDQKTQARSNIGAMENIVAGPDTLGGVKPVLWNANDGIDVHITEEGRLLVNDTEVRGIRRFNYFCNFDSTARKFSNDAFSGAKYGAAIIESLTTQGISQSAPEGLTAPLVIFYGSTDRGKYSITGIDSAGKTFKGSINTSYSNPEYTITITNEIDSDITEGSTNAVQSNAVWDTFQQEYEYVDTTFVSYVNDQTDITNDDSRLIARNNLGIKDPFKVTFTRSYDKVSADKTAKEIKDAASNGQFVYGIFDEDPANIYTLNISNSNDIRFNRLYTETDSNMGLCYNVFYINNPADNFTGNYEETYCYNITAPSIKVVKVKLDNGTYKFDSTGAGTSYSEIFNMCKTSDNNNYTNSDVFLAQENKLYKLDQNPWSMTIPLVFKRVSYDSTTSSILFETFTINTDSTITYESNTFEQNSTQSDWNQNNTTASDYIKNRPGGYYSVVNSVDSGTLTTASFADLSEETGVTSYVCLNETFNTALTNLSITAGKTYRISWTDNGQLFSYISEAIDQVSKDGSVTYHSIQILGDTTIDLTAATNKLIWGDTAKIIFLNNNIATATNTITNIKVEELDVVKIPKALIESDSIEEFDLSNDYTATNKGSIKYIKTDSQDPTVHYALLGFENEDNLYPKLKVSGQELDTSYVNTTEYSSGSIKSSWVNHSETGDTFIQGMAIRHDPNNKLLKLESKLLDNITEDLTVRGIATPTADNDAVNKKYVDDQVYHIKQDISDDYLSTTSEQTLTDAQKQRALSNLGISIPEISIVTLDD